MSAINQVREMQQQGYSESQIIQNLKEQGVSPLEISQSMDQSKIKSAVDNEENISPGMYSQTNEPMEQSVMTQQAEAPIPQSQDYPQYEQQSSYQQQYPQQQQQYQEYQQYQPYQNSDSAAEIAEQIAEEKISAFKKSLGNMEELKTVLSRKVENIDDRLMKIEATIEKLQSAILGKVIGYGQNLEDIKEEMKMMQESFSKAVNPIVEKEESKHHSVKKESKKPGIEHFLRR